MRSTWYANLVRSPTLRDSRAQEQGVEGLNGFDKHQLNELLQGSLKVVAHFFSNLRQPSTGEDVIFEEVLFWRAFPATDAGAFREGLACVEVLTRHLRPKGEQQNFVP